MSSSDVPETVDFASFSRLAAEQLDDVDIEGGALLDRAAALRAKWHPNGFAVFHLGTMPGGGRLRLHIWPTIERVARPKHPSVHCHEWHLASRVLAGVYTDVLYDAAPVAGSAQSWLRGFLIRYQPGRPDIIERSGDAYQIAERERRTVTAGETHCIEAGVFHETTVDSTGFAATLALTSGSVSGISLILGEEAETAAYARPYLSDDQQNAVLSSLRDLL
ncbi:hypothetical protein [Saccharopolyspora sp. 5N708]|uniref:hypothetical protein n=1 Tax=Saccharopolyspora sp. 5N708 TaxID=3457424 RepID=UPI003FD4EE70